MKYSTYTVHLYGFMHYAYISPSNTCTQVHVILSKVEGEPHVDYDDEDEDEDLSDTDPEDEW